MYLQINRVILNNFMSFRHAELDLNGLGYTIVSGQNHKSADSAKSNGSGKSSLFNAISYALTGETIQGLKNNIENIYGDPDNCWVQLEFKVDHDNFTIKRYKTPKSDLKITINGQSMSGKGIMESTKLLEQYLPDLNSILIGSIMILGQGLPYRFADNLPCRRKEILEKLTKSDYMIQSIREKLDNRKFELNSQLRINEDKLVTNTTKVDMYNKQLKVFITELNDITNYNSEYSLNDRLIYLKNKLDKLNSELAVIKLNNEENNKKLDEYQKERVELLTKNSEEKLNLCKEIDAEILELNNKLVEVKTNITLKTSEIKKLENIPDICPTCGQPMPKDKKIDIEPYKADLNILKNLKKDLDKDYNSKLKIKDDLITKFDSNLREQLNKKDLLINSCKQLTQEYNNSINTLTARITKSIAEQVKVQNMKDNFDKISNNIDTINISLLELDKEKENLNITISDLKERLKVISDLFQLTKREFRGVLLENVINYINIRVKQYSTKVFGAELLSFVLNDNDIDIIFNERKYESLSGGEKQKIDIIIQLSLRDLLAAHVDLHTNILVCDEIFDNLDAIGCQKIIDLISELNDIDSTFIISHHVNELQISYDSEIIVEKGEDGCSTISIR